MKRLIRTLLFLFIMTAFSTPAAAQQARFDQANELLEQQQAGEALELYRSIESDHYLSGELLYNMGIASLRQDSLGLAKYYFLRSAGFPGMQEEAGEALRYVNSQFSRRSAVLPKLPWERLFEWLDKLLGPDGLLTIGILLFNLGIAGVIASWFYPKVQRILLRSGQSLIICSLLLAAASFYLHYLDQRFDHGVVTDRQAVVYEQPRTGSASISTAYEGYEVRIDQKRSAPEDGWYYIRLENGMYGWINRQHLHSF